MLINRVKNSVKSGYNLLNDFRPTIGTASIIGSIRKGDEREGQNRYLTVLNIESEIN